MNTKRISTKLQLEFQLAEGAKKGAKPKHVDFDHINQTLTDDLVLEMGHGIAGLIDDTVANVHRIDMEVLAD